MKTILEQMISYSSYHQDPRNKFSHFFGVPLVIFSILIPMGWFRFAPMAWPLSMATLFVMGVSLYYFRLDKTLALLQLPFSLLLLFAAEQVSQLPFRESFGIFAAAFVGGWILQLVGHIFEGRRPALVDNMFQVFNAPLFLILESLFLLGLRREMRSHIQTKLAS